MFPPREILERARIGATVDKEVLAGHVARLRTAEVRARIAELRGIAQPPRRYRLQALGRRLLLRDTARLGEAGQGLARAIGEEGARQEIVDRHVGLPRLARQAGDETGEPGARAVRKPERRQ